MTAPETCPCCRSSDTKLVYLPAHEPIGTSTWLICEDCGCTWDESKRRAQTAEQPIGWYQDPNTVVLNSNNPMAGTDIHGMALYVRAQTAEAVDEAKEREAFELYCKSEHLCTERAYRDPEYYAERNTAFAWYAWLTRARGGN